MLDIEAGALESVAKTGYVSAWGGRVEMRWTPFELRRDRVEIQWFFGASRVQKEELRLDFS